MREQGATVREHGEAPSEQQGAQETRGGAKALNGS